ncbi:hypothetical protein PHLGIDRAFT_436325 [Phlebiopsis gigantea 11061_1 CR5-6]|uniref:Uncharacterized protein n=1 Tax=Phlebiopsis gigantea (strain 11061_1 CR5-6) TaxID=745531 RepID=A0A0C3P1G4_PHLG1|nr:hypothetical protein PHLGIDRAFT_436325 [Phlebiopsis gigantea 11061_1 CR5-6]
METIFSSCSETGPLILAPSTPRNRTVRSSHHGMGHRVDCEAGHFEVLSHRRVYLRREQCGYSSIQQNGAIPIWRLSECHNFTTDAIHVPLTRPSVCCRAGRWMSERTRLALAIPPAACGDTSRSSPLLTRANPRPSDTFTLGVGTSQARSVTSTVPRHTQYACKT